MISKTSQHTQGLREIRESIEFAADRDTLEPDIRRMDEMMTNVQFVLAGAPEQGQRMNKEGVWGMTFGPESELMVLYSFDEHYVDLLGLRRAEMDG